MSAAQPVTPAKPAGGKLERLIAAHKPEAALGAGALGVVGIALYRRSHPSATPAGVPADATTASDGSTAGGVSYDPSDDGSYDPMESVLSLQTSVDQLGNSQAAALASETSILGKLSKTVTAQGKVITKINKQTAPKAKPKKAAPPKQGAKPPRKAPPKKPAPKKPAPKPRLGRK